MGDRRRAHRFLVEKLDGKKPSGRPKSRWKDSIKMDLQIVGRGGKDWLRTGSKLSAHIKCGEFLD
jgi:hypothetical protein